MNEQYLEQLYEFADGYRESGEDLVITADFLCLLVDEIKRLSGCSSEGECRSGGPEVEGSIPSIPTN